MSDFVELDFEVPQKRVSTPAEFIELSPSRRKSRSTKKRSQKKVLTQDIFDIVESVGKTVDPTVDQI